MTARYKEDIFLLNALGSALPEFLAREVIAKLAGKGLEGDILTSAVVQMVQIDPSKRLAVPDLISLLQNSAQKSMQPRVGALPGVVGVRTIPSVLLNMVFEYLYLPD